MSHRNGLQAKGFVLKRHVAVAAFYKSIKHTRARNRQEVSQPFELEKDLQKIAVPYEPLRTKVCQFFLQIVKTKKGCQPCWRSFIAWSRDNKFFARERGFGQQPVAL